MGVRLYKVLPELNIGLQTAIDYLKMINLGEIKDDATVNTKISDEQYEALVKKFKVDKDFMAHVHELYPIKETNVSLNEGSQHFIPTEILYLDDFDRIKEDANYMQPSQMENENNSPYLICYKEATKAYKKKDWDKWVLNARRSIEEFCRQYIHWLCGDNKSMAEEILNGEQDFNHGFPIRSKRPPYGSKLISIIYQVDVEKLYNSISEDKLRDAYKSLSEYSHNYSSNVDKQRWIQNTIEKLYSIFQWTEKRSYADVEAESPIVSLENIKISYMSSNRISYYDIYDIRIEKVDNGNFYVKILDRYIYPIYNMYSYSEISVFYKLLQNGFIMLKQRDDDTVVFLLDSRKINKAIKWGLKGLKERSNSSNGELFALYMRLKELAEFHYDDNSIREFIEKYEILEYSVLVQIGNDKYFAKRESISAEDMNVFWGKDVRFYMKGLDSQLHFVNICIDLKIESNKKEIIKKLNFDLYSRLTILKSNTNGLNSIIFG